MEFTVTKKYMTLPSGRVDNKKVLFYLDGALVYDLDVNLADGWEQADFTAYVDLGRFAGKTLTVVTEPETALVYGTADEMNLPELYREPLRPCLHFTVKNGWNNDPNGLLYADGVYHMFFQYNPCRAQWGNMHWGHATSRDLVHWTEGDIALFPDEYGTMYSGSAVMDDKNLTGLGSAAHPPMLLYYTAAAETPEQLQHVQDCRLQQDFMQLLSNTLMHGVDAEATKAYLLKLKTLEKGGFTRYGENFEGAYFRTVDWLIETKTGTNPRVWRH